MGRCERSKRRKRNKEKRYIKSNEKYFCSTFSRIAYIHKQTLAFRLNSVRATINQTLYINRQRENFTFSALCAFHSVFTKLFSHCLPSATQQVSVLCHNGHTQKKNEKKERRIYRKIYENFFCVRIFLWTSLDRGLKLCVGCEWKRTSPDFHI